MRFRFIEEHGCEFPTNRLCQVLDVSECGLRAFRSRPASQRQRTDMVALAPNLLNRDFHADYPNQKWAGDISYIWTRERGDVSGSGYATRPGDPCLEDGLGTAANAQRMRPSH